MPDDPHDRAIVDPPRATLTFDNGVSHIVVDGLPEPAARAAYFLLSALCRGEQRLARAHRPRARRAAPAPSHVAFAPQLPEDRMEERESENDTAPRRRTREDR